MMEFEINMSEMPLGKLSKSNIQKGASLLNTAQKPTQPASKSV